MINPLNKQRINILYDLLNKIPVAMRMTLLLLCVFAFQLHSEQTYSQQTRISLDMKNSSIEKILQTIEERSEFYFLYNSKLIDVDRKTDIRVKEESIASVLNRLFEAGNVEYEVKGTQIILHPKEMNRIASGLIADARQQQRKQISGQIMDIHNEPVIGANIIEKGTANGTVTDIDGKFTLSVSENAVLVVSYIGYLEQELPTIGRTYLDIVLQEESKSLEEVVVVGYGVQKKINLTGAVGTVSGEVMTASVPTNMVSALQGRLPGVTITQTTGQPGSENPSILIRGIGTMNWTGPMVIVDGIESDMSGISPSDIENISILKDASSAAIYGSRAANGVILITTKRGKSGVSEITYRSSAGWQKTTSLPDHLPSWRYAELYNEGNRNQGIPARYSDDDIAKYKSGVDPYNFPNTDWQALLLTESGFTQNHSVAFSGGNDITSYRASFEYFDQDGLIKRSNHKRYNARINIDSKVRKWLTIGLNTALSRDNVTYPVSPFSGGEEFFRQTNFIPPTVSNKNADGTWNRSTDGNPIAWVEAGGLRNGNSSYLVGSVFGELVLLRGLTLKSVAGVNYGVIDNKKHVVTIDYVQNGVPSTQGPNSVTDDVNRNQAITLQSVLNFDRRFDKHGIKALLGASRESRQNSLNSAYRQNFPSNYLDQLNAGSTAGMTNAGFIEEDRLGSFFGRINYDFDNKYLFEANLRRDASSKFARGYRVGWFPSVSAGWRISQEKFMQNIHWINNLKIRGSWGQLGNNSVPNYYYYQRIKLGQNYNFGGEVADGATQAVPNNIKLAWEKTTELDLGVDIDFFNNKLASLSVDYYNRYTTDILTSIPVSMIFGLPAPIGNAGAMRNKGVELLLEHNNVIGDFQYGVSINGAYNENKVEKFANPSKGDRIYAEGISWGSYYGYEVIGQYQSDAEATASSHVEGAPVKAGDLIFKDQNIDGKIDGDDRIVLGNTIPKITFGFNLNMKYKNFDFSAFFQGASKVYRTLGSETFWAFDPNNALNMHLDRTIVENGQVVKQGYYPRILTTEKHNQDLSSFSVLNASYLRMKNAQLGYSLPAAWLTTVKISKARVYVSGQNLLTFTKFPDSFDPELDSNSATSSYPQVKFYTIGVDLTF